MEDHGDVDGGETARERGERRQLGQIGWRAWHGFGIDRWRDMTLGKQPCISAENEILWRKTLLEVCEGVLSKSQAGIEKIQRVADDDGKAQTWFEAAKKSIEMLWREETRVAAAVIQSLEDNEEF